MFPYKCAFIVCLFVFATTAQNNPNDAVAFPESEENPALKNKDNRQPLYIPAKCPENELYYPGDQNSDWICDCRPSFLYHPPSDACWPSYERGPCAAGEYLMLPKDSVIPVCVKNPCNVNGYVQWHNNCERLGSLAPCASMFPIPAALGVNATTLEVDCVRLNIVSRLGEIRLPSIMIIQCAPGSKRNVEGKCVSQ